MAFNTLNDCYLLYIVISPRLQTSWPDTETKRLKEAVRRNITRFPVDFMFKLKNEE